MSKEADRHLLVGLEIGSSKVVVLVGELLAGGVVNLIGVGHGASQGMDRGGVNDLESVVKSIRQAVDQAELMADCHIGSVCSALSGKHIRCQNELGMVAIADDEVTREDVDSVIHTAKSVRIREEHQILHVVPQSFSIDYQEGIKSPIGLSGVRMQAHVHLITCHHDTAKNSIKTVERCGLAVEQLVFSGLAASEAVLTEDERELGVAVVDIGGGTMDIAVYMGGALCHSQVIPYAGNVVTRDIAYAFGTPLSEAEAIKVRYGCALSALVHQEERIEVPSVGGRSLRQLQRQTLASVIEPRYQELLQLVNQALQQLQARLRQQGRKHQLAAGIVLTGGASQIEGLVACAQQNLNLQVRLGQPLGVTGLTDYIQTPDYATAVGLLQHSEAALLDGETAHRRQHFINHWLKRLSGWLKREFQMKQLLHNIDQIVCKVL